MKATAFDCETTGLIDNPARKLDKQPEIISIAIYSMDFSTGKLEDSFYELFKPTKSISDEITKITKITNEDVANSPPIKDRLDEIISRLEAANLLIGQNIDFDMSMVELECKRYGKKIKWPKILDLVGNTIHLKGYRLSLKNLHIELFGEEFKDAHKADVDVMITLKCTLELMKRGLL